LAQWKVSKREKRVGAEKVLYPSINQGAKTMKKILLAAVILIITAPYALVLAQTTPAKEKPQWVLEQENEIAQTHHSKKTRHIPKTKTGGTAVRGAKQVSPLVVKKDQ
jgi:hypothetical protein